jgi:hypothetical protein
MTPARQERKQRRGLVAAVGVLFVVLAGGAAAIRAATTERVVIDWHTGLAIGGYDPVAYFTDGEPMLGNADIELRHDGAIWRFRNVGNRDAFAAHPEVYRPQFGGYDPVGVAHDIAVPGNAMFWLIRGERLFLFYDGERLKKFSADPERVISAADRKWPTVMQSLTP